jgi:molybdate transport system substrate-binding protein
MGGGAQAAPYASLTISAVMTKLNAVNPVTIKTLNLNPEKKTGRRMMALFLIWLAGINLSAIKASEITIFAASSLTDSLKEIGNGFRMKNPGIILFFSFEASSTLARQIKEGAPCDIFFSADEARMNSLEKDGLVEKSTRKSLLGNTLVIVTASNSTLIVTNANNLADSQINHIAIAEPDTVPAGIYAKQFLVKHDLWTVVENKIIPVQNVRAALAAVESGNAEAGIVYKTDAVISKATKIALEIPAKETSAISYPVAMMKGANDPESSKKFLSYLESPDASQVFKRNGFILPQQQKHP